MHDERWLVKSSGRILGPFTLEELIQHLRARTLSIIDEVREPSSRWVFIREQPLFREVVRQLRDEEEAHTDATQTTFVGGNRTMTLSVTETAAQELELTPNPLLGNPIPRPADVRPIAGRERTVKGGASAGKAFGSLDDQRVIKKIEEKQQSTRHMLWIGALTIALTAGWFLYSHRRSRSIAQDQAQKYMQVARDQVRYGATAKALEYVRKAAAGMDLSPEDEILQAQLLIHEDGKSLEGLRLLSQVNPPKESKSFRDPALTKARAYMLDKRWNEAETEIKVVLQANPKDEEALHNHALLHYYRGQSGPAWQTASELLERGYQNSQLILLKGYLAWQWPDKSSEVARMGQAIDEINRDQDKNYELRFEKDILLMNLLMKAGRKEEVLPILTKIWNQDPFDSRNYLQPLTVDQQLLSWDRLFPLCETVFKTVPDHEGALALRSVCLYQRGETAQALQKMDEARKQLSQSKLLAAAQALLFTKVGRTQEAKTLVDLAPEENLAKLVQGQMCQVEKDLVCAEKAWNAVLAQDPNQPMALYGLAMINKDRGNDLLAREQIRKSLLHSPRYRPFLESRGDSNVF